MNLAVTRNSIVRDNLVTLSPAAGRNTNLKIALVYKTPSRAIVLEEGLREAGFTQFERIPETQNLLARLTSANPDVILIDLETPTRDMLAQMFQLNRAIKRPLTIFVDQSDGAAIQGAVDAGVPAYIVDGLKKERISGIVDLCISRFNAVSQLQADLERAKDALSERKVIDRAKGVLMKAKNLSEDEAYVLTRKTAMSENKKIVEIAESIITASELLK